MASGREYCRGFLDQHGQWNNGFFCPRWGPRDRDYCCGTERHRYCCPPTTDVRQTRNTDGHNAALVTGLAVGCLALLFTAAVVSCYFCRCCWVYKRRKRRRSGLSDTAARHRYSGDAGSIAVRFTVCPLGVYYEDLEARLLPGGSAVYTEQPPPYPGTAGGGNDADVKLPLEEVHGLVQPSIVFNMPPKRGLADEKRRPSRKHDVAYVCSGGATSRTAGRDPVTRLRGCPYRHTRGDRKKRPAGRKTRGSPQNKTNYKMCECRDGGLVIPNPILVHYASPGTCKIDHARQVTARGGPHGCQVKWRLSSGTDRNNERVALGGVNLI
ncbi:hypothetical protein NP493_728g01034 [Ridgeia piscesae]|uniref:Shisa N-terminal domain-containing protein n=1 Tax=Ridgeia piscesae TaxID=27915 RepID=A0AAD9NP14_RIDPI|nr:hypothetical protein NP493_728g01034 [Ridgeia piscesae]